MRILSFYLSISLTGLVLTGCATTQHSTAALDVPAVAPATAAPNVVQASYSEAEPEGEDLPPLATFEPEPFVDVGNAQEIGLPDLIGLAVQRNPRLAQVSWTVAAARGRAIQAGLYPNPTVNISGNEVSDRTGPAGIWSAYAGQEIVTANKLSLSQAVAFREVDQTSLNLIAERYRVFTEIRQAYFEAMTLQRRADILRELVTLAEQTVDNANRLLAAKEAAELDVVQLEVDLERYRADWEATQRALPAEYRRLAASVGVEDLAIYRLSGDLDMPLPDYDLDRLRTYVVRMHPELRSAEVGVERAQLALRRATVDLIPNVTVGAGYTYQGQNRSSDWDIGVSVPLPVWNKNQGNIYAARAQVSEAASLIERVRNDLVNQLATAYSSYAAARERSERYQTAILPRARRTFDLSQRAYQGGQFEYLRVIQAQRAVAEANLELVRSQGEMWQSASEIAGLMLEDQWPLPPAAPLPETEQL